MSKYSIGVGHKRDMFFAMQDTLIVKVFYSMEKLEDWLEEQDKARIEGRQL